MSIATLGAGFAWFALAAAARAEGVRTLRELGCRRVRTVGLRLSLRCAAALAGGLSVLLWIPLREAGRVGDLGHWQWSWMIATGGTFWEILDGPATLPASFAPMLGHFSAQFLPIGVVIGLVGALWLSSGRRAALGVGLVLALAGNVVVLHGFRVHDAEVFFLPAYAIMALWIGAGCHVLASYGAGWIGRPAAAVGFAALGLLLPAGLAWRNASQVDLSERVDAREYGRELVRSLPEGAVLVKFDHHEEWKLFSVLLYFQRALGERPDVVVHTAPSAPFLRCRFDAGYPLFAFQPGPQLEELGFALRDEGFAWRLSARAGAPAPAPRAVDDPLPACAARIRA